MNPKATTLAVAISCIALVACDPDDGCDPGYYADHGYCYLLDAGPEVIFFGDAGLESDGGVIIQDPTATFGKPCQSQSECGGVAPVCGGPMLPICTTINCLDTGEDTCPPGWLCVDVTKYDPFPGITHVCVDL